MYCVVFCVGRRAVDLHDLPAVHFPHISDLHRQRDTIAELIERHTCYPLVKGRVGQAIAKGVIHRPRGYFCPLSIRLSIGDCADVMSRLIVPVPNVHAFLVLDVIQSGRLFRPIVIRGEDHALGICINHITEVGLDRILQQLCIPDINSSARRIDVACENITQGLKPCVARMPDPDNGVTRQRALHQLLNLHDIGGVEHSNCRPAMRLGKGNGPLFRFGKRQDMRGTIRQWSGRVICAFTADASDVNHADISGTGISQLHISGGINFIYLSTVVIDIFPYCVGYLIRGNLHNPGFLQHLQTGLVD